MEIVGNIIEQLRFRAKQGIACTPAGLMEEAADKLAMCVDMLEKFCDVYSDLEWEDLVPMGQNTLIALAADAEHHG